MCSPTFEPDPLLPFDITKSVKNEPHEKGKVFRETFELGLHVLGGRHRIIKAKREIGLTIGP